MKTKNKKFYIQAGILSLSLAYQHMSFALGIHKEELSIQCKGTLEISEVNSVGATAAFYNRAGVYIPSKGTIHYKVKVKNTEASCEAFDIDFTNTTFESMQFLKETNKDALKKIANSEIGHSYPFHTEQYYQYVNENGYLPYYPLAVGESVQIVTKLYLGNNTLKTVEPKAFLTEEEKLELTEVIFKHLKDSNYADNALNNSSLYKLSIEHPHFESNFKDYLVKLLAVFKIYEEKSISAETFDFPLSILATQISEMTNSYPEFYHFNLPELISEHPSLFKNTRSFPNMSAIDLENALLLLKENFQSHSVNEKVKANFKEVLNTIAGHSLGGKLSQLSSQKAKDLAQELLTAHY